MDKIKLLQARRQQLFQAGKTIREEINGLIDKDSFVELSSFSFSRNDFYGEDAEGEGVITGFATINEYPFYIIAQNAEVMNGGISKAACQKICKCLEQAEKKEMPVIYLLSTLGVQIGENVNVLEGIAQLVSLAVKIKGFVPQYLVVNGEVYGQIALLAGICDCTFFVKDKSVLAPNSPLVICAASGKNLSKNQVGGAEALHKAQLATFTVDSLNQVKDKIIAISDLLFQPVVDSDELNKTLSSLSSNCNAQALMGVFDKGTAIEFGATYAKEARCFVGRIGGIAVAAVIFDNDNGVSLCANKMRKLTDFAYFSASYGLPYVTFVNTLGITAGLETNNSPVLKECGEYIGALACMQSAKISVVYGKAIGLGYTIFAAKSMGYDFTYAFANAKIALFDDVQGAEIEFADAKNVNKDALAQKYSDENSDPINAAKGGYIDNIIEPQFVKQYLVASLQMLQR